MLTYRVSRVRVRVSVEMRVRFRSSVSGMMDRRSCKYELVPRSEQFECQVQRSKVKVTVDKNALCIPIIPSSDGMERARCK